MQPMDKVSSYKYLGVIVSDKLSWSPHIAIIFLYGHAEWVETKDLTLGNIDSHLRIKVTVL